MAENQIGDFEFLSLHGDPTPLKEHMIVLSRPGVTGVALWRTGRRGVPFALRSIVDQRSFADADQTFNRYLDLVGADPVALVWSDIDETRSYGVCVLDVRRLRQSGLLCSVGGLASPSAAYLECEWDLIAVKPEES